MRSLLPGALALACAAAWALGACGAAAPRRAAPRFVFAPLAYDTAAIREPGQPAGTGSGFDPQRDALDGAQLPGGAEPQVASWPVAGVAVPFELPGAQGDNAVILPAGGPPVAIGAPPGAYRNLYFLEGVGGGPAVVDVGLTYAGGGAPVQQRVPFDDWCGGAGNLPAFPTADRVDAAGGLQPFGCGLFVRRVALDPGRRLLQVTAAADASSSGGAQVNVVAVTLQR